MKLLLRFRALFRRDRLDAEMAEEMRHHLDTQMRRNLAEGMSLEDARYAAQRAFGGVEQIKERARDERARGFLWLDQLLQDTRFAARGLARSPVFTAVATLTFALGIGLNTSMFTGLQSVLMREVSFPEADRLVQVFRTSPHSQRWPHSPANFLDQQAQNGVFEHMAAFSGKSFNLAEPGQPAERIGGVHASAEIFPLLGWKPMLGRVFSAEDDQSGRPRVAVLDHDCWQRRFAGDPAIIGRTLRLDSEPVTVIGVMPPAFRDRRMFGVAELWMPLAWSAEQRANRGGNFLKAVARLKPGVSLAQAQAAMEVLAANQTRAHPDTNSGIGLRVVAFADSIDPRGRMALWATMALAGFVLLIACANLANLQFARTAHRTRELAIRVALGASRGRLLRQLLTESCLIALLGGALGLVLAHWGNALLARQINQGGELVLALNWRVLAFALGASSLSGFGFGLVPAWLASRANANDAMKSGARGVVGDRSRRRLQHALIVAEVALAFVLLAGAGLMVRGVQRFMVQDPGWQVDGVTVGNLSLPGRTYGSASAQRAFAKKVQEELAAQPGVERAAVAWSLPIRHYDTAGTFAIAGQPARPPGREPIRQVVGITPGYFATLGMRLRAGRDFTANDREGQPAVVIINEAMARAFWPGASPLGARLGDETVVGVVNDVQFATDPSEPMTPFQTYRPFAQTPRGSNVWLAVRGPVSAEMLRRTVAAIDADLPVNEPGLARVFVDRSVAQLGGMGWMLSGFGALGLLLASLGIYGVIAGFAAQRTNEIGVRMALGAQVSDVLWLVLSQGLRLTLLGAALGLIAALIGARVFASLAPGLAADDPLTLVGVAVLLVGVALIACWLPARRAARVDPLIALRSD